MLTVELAQLSLKDGDIDHNLQRAEAVIASASEQSDIIVFPETFFSGFPNKENLDTISQPLDGSIITRLSAAANKKGIAVVAGFSEKAEDGYYNASFFIDPEKGLLATYRKTHMWLTDRGIFSPGDRYTTFLWRGVRIGLLICFDIEFPESARANGELGADLLLVTNGNMDPYYETHRSAIMARSQENQCYSVIVNRVGKDSYGHVFAGGSCVVNPFGEILLEAGREECRQIITIDPTQCSEYRRDYDYLKERRFTLTGKRVEHEDGRYELIIP